MKPPAGFDGLRLKAIGLASATTGFANRPYAAPKGDSRNPRDVGVEMSFELKAKRVRYSISASGWGPCVPACLILVLPEPFQGLVDLLRGDLVQTRVAKRAEPVNQQGAQGTGE